MKNRYNFNEIESKWQNIWENSDDFHAEDISEKKKYYVLVEFPYPSGEGLHVGHLRSYVALDIVARKRRMQGYNVLYPMGWDAFGLPAENYALKHSVHPKVITEENVFRFKTQLKRVGLSFDWKREVNTTDPSYYKWTQWIFSRLFEKGLASKEDSSVNWCTSCKCVLANEEVVNGVCERCGAEVIQKRKKQWILKITKYAQRLVDDLKLVDYPTRVKQQQENWIGRSEGAKISFESSVGENFDIFTTRPETIFGVSHVIFAPEHKFIDKYAKDIKNIDEVMSYRAEASKKKKEERSNVKTGLKINGITAKNPINGKDLPIFVSDYVLVDHGTGIVMAVPAHDDRDFDFVQKYKIDFISVIKEDSETRKSEMINSEFLNGLDIKSARERVLDYITEKKIGSRYISFKLRDWIFSRQRYWGEPIPIIHCEKCGMVLDKNLPLVLPDLKEFRTSDTGESPLCLTDWIYTKCPKCGGKATRETDTMPQWAGSSWYSLRYIDPLSESALASKESMNYWMPVDWYNGGMEHTTLHLLYSRFWHKFLYDIGVVKSPEPYAKRTSHGIILGSNGEKMSKSRGNVVNPNDVIDEYGADVTRLYEMFMGDFEKSAPWDPKGIVGCKRFLEKYWSLQNIIVNINTIRDELKIYFNRTIKKVSEDIENLKFNTAISSMMELVSKVKDFGSISKCEMKILTTLLNPFAPHISSEMWNIMEFDENVVFSKWPEFDEKFINSSKHEIVVQINGKVKTKFNINSDVPDKKLIEICKKNEKVVDFLKGKNIIKEICVSNKLVNFVVG